MSQQSRPILPITVAATGNVTKRRFVTVAGVQAGAAARALGVSRTDGVAGDQLTVDVLGTAVVEAGAAVAAGAQVEADASARAITKAAGVVLGHALEAAGAAGDFIEVLLIAN